MKDSLDILCTGDYVEHHGIKGMHWGIRRYQPYPKSYNGSGKFIGKKTSYSDKEYYEIRRAINNKYNVENNDDDMSPKERVNTKLGKATYFENASYWAENNKEYENCARFVNDAKKLVPKAVDKADAAFKEKLTNSDKKKYGDLLETYGSFDGLSVYGLAGNSDNVRKNYTKSDINKYASLKDYMVFVPIGKPVEDPYYKSSSAQLVIEFRNGKPMYEIQTGDSSGYPYADKDKK